jgi:hypothetical protein
MGKNNVNPDHYKTAGRLPTGEAIRQRKHARDFEQNRTRAKNQFVESRVGEEHSEGSSENEEARDEDDSLPRPEEGS